MNMDGLLVSVVVHDLDRAWTGLAIRPFEADTPLIVDANGILSHPVTPELL